ncbi:hypothetical protein Lser_V15G12358 [Lactuca serriola]
MGFRQAVQARSPRYGKCGNMHEGACKAGISGCFKCGRTGHMSRDCTATTNTTTISNLVCFQYNQRGHKRAQCPGLAAAGQVAAPDPATLRITDGHQGRVEAPTARSRAFQLTAEDAREAPDVVMGSFLVNGISALIMFNTGATRSFVSLALRKRFVGAPGELDCPLDVKITDDRIVRVARVHRGCTLRLFDEQFFVDLVPIPLRGNKIIVGMD